jgi:hypothetical protein
VCWRWGGAGVCVDRMRGQRGGLCHGSKETKDRGIDFFFRAERGGLWWEFGSWGIYVLPDHNEKRILLNFTVLTHGYLVTLSSSIVIVLGIVLKPPIHSSHRAKSTTAKALRIQRNA